MDLLLPCLQNICYFGFICLHLHVFEGHMKSWKRNTLIFIFTFCYHTLITHIVKTSVFHNTLSSKYILHFDCIQLPHCLPSLIPLQRLLLPISPFFIFDLFICMFTTLWVSLDVFIRQPEGICYRIRLSPLAMFNPTETLREW